MAYDPELADRIRDLVADEGGITEQRMFGGLAFVVNGHMAVAASGRGGLLVRVDANEGSALIDGEQVTPMVMRGREMRGWIHVVSQSADRELGKWVSRGVAYARSLPPKGK